jgi:hypothetical protein
MTYTPNHLSGLSLPDLKVIAAEINATPIGDKRCKKVWVAAILTKQPVPQEPIAPKTCATCSYYQSRNDGTDKGWCNLFNQFAREIFTKTQDCINTAENQEPQTDDYLFHDEQVTAQSKLKELIKEQSLQVTREEQAKSVQVVEKHTTEYGIQYVTLSNDNYYVVTPDHPNPKERCECGDCHYRGAKCKHQIAVENSKRSLNPPINNLSEVGSIYFIGDFLLRCSAVATDDYAVVWDVCDGNSSMGKIMMDYAGFWHNSQGISTLITSYEAVTDLCEHAQIIELAAA